MFFPFNFILLIIALGIGGWVITTWIRARHGYPLDDGAGGRIEPSAGPVEFVRLRQETARLAEQLENCADRIAVLERIVTDRGFDIATQIEALGNPERGPQPARLGQQERDGTGTSE